MTIDDIEAATTDDELYDLIARELQSRLPPRTPIEPFLAAIRSLPPGLRAMAATYELDVSITLDDLGWHFGNWHHEGLAEETIQALRELGSGRMAELVSDAFEAAQQFWSELGSPNWHEWYVDSAFEKTVRQLNREAWSICDQLPKGLFSYWLSYARQYPERLVDATSPE
jgi:hypothetical protein